MEQKESRQLDYVFLNKRQRYFCYIQSWVMNIVFKNSSAQSFITELITHFKTTRVLTFIEKIHVKSAVGKAACKEREKRY